MRMNPTKVCTAMIEWYLNEYDKDIGSIFMMEHIAEQIKTMQNEIAQLEHKKNLVTKLTKEFNVLKETYEDSKGQLEYQYLINYLNRRIIAYQFDEKETQQKQSDIITKIKKFNNNFNLRQHIDKVRLLREETLL